LRALVVTLSMLGGYSTTRQHEPGQRGRATICIAALADLLTG
jgi:hypothetical protein